MEKFIRNENNQIIGIVNIMEKRTLTNKLILKKKKLNKIDQQIKEMNSITGMLLAKINKNYANDLNKLIVLKEILLCEIEELKKVETYNHFETFDFNVKTTEALKFEPIVSEDEKRRLVIIDKYRKIQRQNNKNRDTVFITLEKDEESLIPKKLELFPIKKR